MSTINATHDLTIPAQAVRGPLAPLQGDGGVNLRGIALHRQSVRGREAVLRELPALPPGGGGSDAAILTCLMAGGIELAPVCVRPQRQRRGVAIAPGQNATAPLAHPGPVAPSTSAPVAGKPVCAA